MVRFACVVFGVVVAGCGGQTTGSGGGSCGGGGACGGNIVGSWKIVSSCVPPGTTPVQGSGMASFTAQKQ